MTQRFATKKCTVCGTDVPRHEWPTNPRDAVVCDPCARGNPWPGDPKR